MKIEESKVLIFGAGSIGERHINNLLALGCSNITVYRQRNLPMRNVDASKVKVINDLNLINEEKFDCAFVTSPTALHLQQTMWCVERGIPVLVEKPLTHQLEGLEKLRMLVKQQDALVHIGYMMRYHPLLKKVKQWVESEQYGRLIYCRTYWGEYLPHWHPWEDYKTSYAARKEMGGGVALTLSHDIDVVNWMVGVGIDHYQTMFNYRSTLEIDVESGADVQLKYSNGVTAHVHLNFFQKHPQREYQFEFDQASVRIDFFKSSMTLWMDGREEKIVAEGFERNDLFIEQTQSFFNKLEEGDYTKHSLQQMEESEWIIKICQNG